MLLKLLVTLKQNRYQISNRRLVLQQDGKNQMLEQGV